MSDNANAPSAKKSRIEELPPSPEKLPRPPSCWVKELMERSRLHEFCKNCENVCYIENELGGTVQLVHECTCL